MTRSAVQLRCLRVLADQTVEDLPNLRLTPGISYGAAVQQRLEQPEVVNGRLAANLALNAKVLHQPPSPKPSCPS
jgi:hypothetical protein